MLRKVRMYFLVIEMNIEKFWNGDPSSSVAAGEGLPTSSVAAGEGGG